MTTKDYIYVILAILESVIGLQAINEPLTIITVLVSMADTGFINDSI